MKSQTDFVQLYDAQVNRVRSVLFRLCEAQAVEDLTQEVFLKVWKNRAQFEGKSSISTWVYRIALNTAHDWYRRKHDRSDKNFVESDFASPVSLSTQLENQNLAQVALQHLSAEQRGVVVLHYYEDLSVLEIAEVLEISEGTVKSRLHSSRLKLQDYLASNKEEWIR